MTKKKKRVAVPAKALEIRGSRTVNDLMDSIEVEILAIKNGELSEAKARVVAKNRQMQLKGIELVLQAARIEARFKPELGRRMGMPPLEGMLSTLPQ